MKKFIKSTILASILLLAVFTLTACSAGKTSNFKKPDIKDDFCGVSMDYRYCKCAFHNQFCDEIGLSSGAANSYVYDEYNNWLEQQKKNFANNCETNGGIYNGSNSCKYCEEPYYKDGNKCVKADDVDEGDNNAESTAFKPDGPFDSSCNINQEQFDNEWKKYSDFDDRIDFNSRSYEVQQNFNLYEKILNLKARNFELERDMEIDRQLRLSMREYKTALVQNIRTNLLKSFWRLSYVTYSTIKSAKGLGESYSTVLTSAETIPRISAGLKVVQGVIPGDSKLAIDTKTASGKVKSIGLNSALEAFDSMGDPVKIATQVFTDSRNAALPSADITPEEIEILRTQHLENGELDKALASSYRLNAIRRMELIDNRNWIIILEAEAALWEAKEKARIKVMLESDCRLQKEEFENQETSFLDLFINKVYAMDPSAQQYEIGDYKVDYDTNDEGEYYLGDKLVLSVYDTDDDGQDDLWIQYDDEFYVVLEAYDTTGDGDPDIFVELDREEVVNNLIQPDIVMPEVEEVTNNTFNDVEKDVKIIDESKEGQGNSKTVFGIIILLGLGFFIYIKKRMNK